MAKPATPTPVGPAAPPPRSLLSRALATAEPDVHSRARILAWTALMTLVLSIAIIVACLASPGAHMSKVLFLVVAMLVGGVTLLALGRAQRVEPVAIFFVMSMQVVISASAFTAGGLRSASLIWLTCVPVISHLLIDRRLAIVSAGLGVFVTLAYLAGELTGVVPYMEDPALILAAMRSGAIVFLAGYAVSSGASRERAIAETTAAVRLLTRRETELQEALAGLQREVAARELVETELRMAQKLEAVGRLSAGVAHEINTPVQFVADSVCFVKDGVAGLLSVLQAQRTALEAAASGEGAGGRVAPEIRAAVAKAEEEADLTYLIENLPKSLERSIDGLERIASIVRAMKEFAYQGASEVCASDLNRAIRSTLTIAAHEYKLVADVKTDLGELPAVTCNIGEINQVVLNLIVNAAHAIEDVVGTSGQRGTIEIGTHLEGDEVVVTVRDTGAGIPEEARARIFDPFFTTKELGRGSGQGLTVVRSVVERHGGKIAFDTRVGQGTTFTVFLPVEPRQTVQHAA